MEGETRKSILETLREAVEAGPGWVGSWRQAVELDAKLSPEDWKKIEKVFEEGQRSWNAMWVLPFIAELERLEKEITKE